MKAKQSKLHWQRAWRIIPSVFPPKNLFERVAHLEDLEAVIAIESMTNDRIRDEIGELQLVPHKDRICGPGTGVIMAAFTHLNPQGSRFTDGSYGVFYTSKELKTSIAETRYHREQFLRATMQAPIELDMRVYTVCLKGWLHDIRHEEARFRDCYHPSNYAYSQQFAKTLRLQGSNGLVYRSVRHPEGINAAIFRPTLLSHCKQAQHLCYRWDGKAISEIYRKELISVL
jgi:hypothetical protein